MIGRGPLALGAAMLVLAGCGELSLETAATSPPATEARTVAEALARGDLGTVTASLDPRWAPDDIARLSSVSSLFPATARSPASQR